MIFISDSKAIDLTLHTAFIIILWNLVTEFKSFVFQILANLATI